MVTGRTRLLLVLLVTLVAAPRAARAESFAFTREGAELPVWMERVAVAHGAGATVTTVSLEKDVAATEWIVELPEGTEVGSVVRVASPFPALDVMANPRVVVATEIDPCDAHAMPSTAPALTCAGVPGSSEPAATPLGVWEAHFRARTRGPSPVRIVTASDLSGVSARALGVVVPPRAQSYARAHSRAIFALTDAEAISFKGSAPTYLWPSRTGPNDGGPAWVELTALDREQRVPRLPAHRRARVDGVVLASGGAKLDEGGSARLTLAREVLSRSGADVFEEVVAPHACLVDATEEALVALGFAELAPGPGAAGFDPSTIPEPRAIVVPCPATRSPGVVMHKQCTPSTTIVAPERALGHVPTFWPSLSRWLGHPGRTFELEFAERPAAPTAVLASYERRDRWTDRLRCRDPKPGRYVRKPMQRHRYEPELAPVTYPPFELPFAQTFDSRLSVTVAAAERAPAPESAVAWRPEARLGSASAPPRPPPVARPSGGTCDVASPVEGAGDLGLWLPVVVAAFVARRRRRASVPPPRRREPSAETEPDRARALSMARLTRLTR